jgi:fructokinase
MILDPMQSINLSIQAEPNHLGQPDRIVAIGEVLWDLLPSGATLGGAPLNFAVHARRLGYWPLLISAVGADQRGRDAVRAVRQLTLESEMLQTTPLWPTGTATVHLDGDGQPTFTIHRPAAYDAVVLTAPLIAQLQQLRPAWVYFGTLFSCTPEGLATLTRFLDALPRAQRFYDVNLRPGFEPPALVLDLLGRATVLKLNEAEVTNVSRISGLPQGFEDFCREGAARFGWSTVCVTLGARGCAIWRGGEYVVASGYHVAVADSVGAGDAFAAAFLHGLSSGWPTRQVADFANRVGAIVASRVGATPDWNLAEATQMYPGGDPVAL